MRETISGGKGKEETQKVETHERSWVHYFQKGKAKVLSNGKIAGDPGT